MKNEKIINSGRVGDWIYGRKAGEWRAFNRKSGVVYGGFTNLSDAARVARQADQAERVIEGVA